MEDRDDDAALIIRAIRQAGFEPSVTRVETAAELAAALNAPTDLVISDHSLPSFSSTAALALIQQAGLDVPFIVVSGTIDEHVAVTILRAGAHDFVTKQNLVRLGPAIGRELDDARQRAGRREAERRLQQTEEALRLSDEQLRHAQKMEAVGQLAGGIAHDFNNLLTAIVGYADLLLQDCGSHEDGVRADLEEIRRAGERASSLTRQLLAFSRKQALEPRVLDLNEVVAVIERMLRRLIGGHIHLEVDLDPSLHPVWADPGQIEQVLWNLAINARDAMPQGGTLRLRTANAGPPPDAEGAGRVSISVEDTGCGIRPEHRARIFEPFFTTKGPSRGTGLGLAMVHGVVTQSGGAIHLESALDQGTRFTIEFPAIPAPSAASAADRPEVPAQIGGSETVLVVEDEPAIRDLVCRVLRQHGYRVLEARDVMHAVTVAERERTDLHLLLTDVVMPQMTGPELAQRLVPMHRHLRVLYMSGFGTLATDRGTLSPAVALIHKPFDAASLLRKLRQLLDRSTPECAHTLGEPS